MTKTRKRLLIFTPLAVALVGLIVLLAVRGDSAASEEPAAQVETQAVPVRVVEVTEMTLPQTVSYSGSIEPWEQALVTGPQGARIERVLVREGDRVRRGQVLIHMENASLQQAQAQMSQARADLDRMERLVEVGSVSRQQAEQARMQFENAESQVRSLSGNTHLRAPIDGVVVARHFTGGETFMAGAGAPSIVTVMQTNPVRVVVNVSERYFPVVRRGMPAVVRLDTYGDRAFRGTIEQILPTVSAESRTFRVEVRVDNPNGELSPGMFARVELDMGEVMGQFLPSGAVLQTPGTENAYVYVIEDGVAHRIDITAGNRVEAFRRIEAGLPAGATVVSEGAQRLTDGSRVRIVG